MTAVRRDGYVLPAESFPASFQASLTAYLDFVKDPPDDDDAPLHGLRPTTLANRKFRIRQMASALVHRGAPISEVTSLSSLLAPTSVNAICDFFTERSGHSQSVQLQGLLQTLRLIAHHQLKDPDLAGWLGRRMRRLGGRQFRRWGMTEKNRRRLAVFRDPQRVRELLLLPYKLLKRAKSGSLPMVQAARLARAAAAIELEIMCPIRLANLSEIDIDTSFVRSHAGKDAAVHLFVSGERTKNGEDIELELPHDTMALIDRYLTKYRNHLINPECRGTKPRLLFPMRDGKVKAGRVLADCICRIMQRELGIQFNMHLFRHLGCYLYLRSHPGQIDVMRRVLGHKDSATTMRYYAFIEQSDAFRMFDAHVLQIREETFRPSRKRPFPRAGGVR